MIHKTFLKYFGSRSEIVSFWRRFEYQNPCTLLSNPQVTDLCDPNSRALHTVSAVEQLRCAAILIKSATSPCQNISPNVCAPHSRRISCASPAASSAAAIGSFGDADAERDEADAERDEADTECDEADEADVGPGPALLAPLAPLAEDTDGVTDSERVEVPGAPSVRVQLESNILNSMPHDQNKETR